MQNRALAESEGVQYGVYGCGKSKSIAHIPECALRDREWRVGFIREEKKHTGKGQKSRRNVIGIQEREGYGIIPWRDNREHESGECGKRRGGVGRKEGGADVGVSESRGAE